MNIWPNITKELLTVKYRGTPYKDIRNPEIHIRGPQVTCLALSSDGIHWTKPELGLFKINGTYKNNVVMAGNQAVCHNFSPFIDTRPGVPTSERFKAMAGSFKYGLDENEGIWAFVSEDGIHWNKIQDNVVMGPKHYPKNADESSIPCFWSESENCYVANVRTRQGSDDLHEYVKTRWIGRTTSPDFINWTKVEQMEYEPVYSPEEMVASNENIDTSTWKHFNIQGGGREQLYTNQTQPYFRAPHIYIALPMRYVWGAVTLSQEELDHYNMPYGYFSHSTSDGVFMTSRGGLKYDQLFREAFFTAGRDRVSWAGKNCMASNGIVPTADDELSIYYSALLSVFHNPCSTHLLRCTIRTDGFASVNAPYEGGEFITKPFLFKGNKLDSIGISIIKPPQSKPTVIYFHIYGLI